MCFASFLAATRASIERLISEGVSGVIVLPMLGENASMNMQEREAVIRAAVEVAAGRVPVLSGLAEITLQTARQHAALYKSFGAQGLMVFPCLGQGRHRERQGAPSRRALQAGQGTARRR